MGVNEVKTIVDGLVIGMFVSRLDRPWLETPFLLEGMKIEDTEQIEQLRKYCSYVFVDVDSGPAPAPHFCVALGKSRGQKNNGVEVLSSALTTDEQREYTILHKRNYTNTENLTDELNTATPIYDEVYGVVQDMMVDLKIGRTLNFSRLQIGISAMVSSIERNPSAFALVNQLRRKDDYSYTHALGTSMWCAIFGRHLGLERYDIDALALGGMLLDVGKAKQPPELISKPGPLTHDEYEGFKAHVSDGVRIVANIKKLQQKVVEMVATHHERADGSGYPKGLSNKDIPIFGRIAGIVDSYDAMTTKRPYRDKALSPHEAISELYACRGSIFQAELVEQFIQTVGLFPAGSLIELNTGEVGIVVEVNGLKRLRPTIMVLLDPNKDPYEDFRTIDLIKVKEIEIKQGLPSGAFGIDENELFL